MWKLRKQCLKNDQKVEQLHNKVTNSEDIQSIHYNIFDWVRNMTNSKRIWYETLHWCTKCVSICAWPNHVWFKSRCMVSLVHALKQSKWFYVTFPSIPFPMRKFENKCGDTFTTLNEMQTILIRYTQRIDK